jgi:hypothetical protein
LPDVPTAVEGCEGPGANQRACGAPIAADAAATAFSSRRNPMKRFILTTTAALALAACADTTLVIDTRAPPGSPNYLVGPAQTIFTTQTPERTSIDSDGGREVGTLFSVYANGSISGFRFWKAAGESGTHTARLWTTSGTLLASATFSNESSSGWQAVGTFVAVAAGTYVVTVNTNVKMVKTAMYFDSIGPISHDNIYANLSYHGQPAGSFPIIGASGIYFVDVNFRPLINVCVPEPGKLCPPDP